MASRQLFACGSNFFVAIGHDGKLWGFGGNRYRQLGIGGYKEEYDVIPSPIEVPVPVRVVSVSCGYFFTACLDEDGCVWVTGELEETHSAPYTSTCQPVKVPGFEDIVSIHCGSESLFAIDIQGRIWTICGQELIGIPKEQECELDQALIELRAEVNASNYNYRKHCPTSDSDNSEDGEYEESDGEFDDWLPSRQSNLPELQDIRASSQHCVMLTKSGSVLVCGTSNRGNRLLGLGEQCVAPVPVAIPDLPKISSISVGYYFSALLTESGEIYTFGANESGQLGLGDLLTRKSPALVSFPAANIVQCGYSSLYVVDSSGFLWSCGANDIGQLGYDTESAQSLFFRQVDGVEDGIAVAAGGFSMVKTADGRAFTLGEKTSLGSAEPKEVDPEMAQYWTLKPCRAKSANK